jgi:hypothetical protein
MSKFDYRFDSKNKILYKYYYGEISITDITTSWDYAIQNKLIPEGTLGFILDYTHATFQIKISEYNQIPLYYKQHPEHFFGHRIAIITNNPADTVITMLVKEKDAGYESQPFATEEAAQRWVLQKVLN